MMTEISSSERTEREAVVSELRMTLKANSTLKITVGTTQQM